MAEEKKKITFGNIGNALKSVATDHITAVAGDVFDEERQKYQNEVNTDLETTDNEIKADLEAETARAQAAEEANAQGISSEIARATAAEQAIIFDVSAYNDGAVFESISALLSNSNLNTIIPVSFRHGGMTIRYVQTSDNKYVQYRLMTNVWSATLADWQGIDDEPTAGSDNIVKSGGVANKLAELEEKIEGSNAVEEILPSITTNNVQMYYISSTENGARSITGGFINRYNVSAGERIKITGKSYTSLSGVRCTFIATNNNGGTFAQNPLRQILVGEDSAIGEKDFDIILTVKEDEKYLYLSGFEGYTFNIYRIEDKRVGGIVADIADINNDINRIKTEATGGIWDSWTWIEDAYISNTGLIVKASDLRYSKPVHVSAGDVIKVTGTGTGISAISKISESVITPIVIMDSAEYIKDYIWIANEECYVIISGRYNRTTGNVEGNINYQNSIPSFENIKPILNTALVGEYHKEVRITDGGEWQKGPYYCIGYNVSGYDRIKIVTKGVVSLALLKSYNYSTGVTRPDFCEGEVKPRIITQSTSILEIPTDCHIVLLSIITNNNLLSINLVSEFDILKEETTAIEKEVDRLSKDLYVENYSLVLHGSVSQADFNIDSTSTSATLIEVDNIYATLKYIPVKNGDIIDFDVTYYTNRSVVLGIFKSLAFGTKSNYLYIERNVQECHKKVHVDIDGYLVLYVNEEGNLTTKSLSFKRFRNKELISEHLTSPEFGNSIKDYNTQEEMMITSLNKSVACLNKKSRFVFAQITDSHADSVKTTKRLVDWANGGIREQIDILIHTGDINQLGFDSPQWKDFFTEYNESLLPFFIALGNHDQCEINGTGTLQSGDAIKKIYDRWIAPVEAKGFITNIPSGKTYYYHDNSNYRVRFIVINDYDPMYDDFYTEDSHKVNYYQRRYSKEQLDWFIEALSTMNEGWTAIVCKHANDSIHRIIEDWTATNVVENGNGVSEKLFWNFNIRGGNPIFDIIDAYQHKKILSKTYTHDDSAITSHFPDGISVSADFRNAKGTFAFIAEGHAHLDMIGYGLYYPNNQKSEQPIEYPDIKIVVCANAGHFEYSPQMDMGRSLDYGKSQDCINVYSIDTENRKVYIVRVGANFTLDGKMRSITSFEY